MKIWLGNIPARAFFPEIFSSRLTQNPALESIYDRYNQWILCIAKLRQFRKTATYGLDGFQPRLIAIRKIPSAFAIVQSSDKQLKMYLPSKSNIFTDHNSTTVGA